MRKRIDSLRLHKQNKVIYGDTDPADVANLAKHLEQYGQITAIVVTKSGTVISGARRIAAAKILGWSSIEATVKDIPKAHEISYIIAANKQRTKTYVQICNEIDALYMLYSKGQGYRVDLDGTDGAATCSGTRNKTTRLQVAADLGIASSTITHLRYIRAHRPDILPYIGESITLNSAYAQVKLFQNQEDVVRLSRGSGNGNGSLEGVDFQLYTKSSADMHELDDNSIDHVITSPPYKDQRFYLGTNGHGPELGREKTIDEYVANLLEILSECKRVMRPTGSMMLVIGDTYSNQSKQQIPERVSIAVQDQIGLFLRNTLIWAKGPSMTSESTKRRRHTDFEFVYHFVKDTQRYYYSADEIRVPYTTDVPIDRKPPRHYGGNLRNPDHAEEWQKGSTLRHPGGKIPGCILEVGRQTTPLDIDGEVEHTAGFPDRLIRELLKPIAQPGDILLDPFSGSGTVGAVGAEFGCSYVGYDLNPAFNSLASKRLRERKVI